jgi:hypothetical protein
MTTAPALEPGPSSLTSLILSAVNSQAEHTVAAGRPAAEPTRARTPR